MELGSWIPIGGQSPLARHSVLQPFSPSHSANAGPGVCVASTPAFQVLKHKCPAPFAVKPPSLVLQDLSTFSAIKSIPQPGEIDPDYVLSVTP